MARPKIGIFGALMALGGYLAVRYVQQRNRAAQGPATRELNRWENEGGAVAPLVPPASVASAPDAQSGRATNGAAHSNGHDAAWPFPRS